jgi:hypothetical protein
MTRLLPEYMRCAIAFPSNSTMIRHDPKKLVEHYMWLQAQHIDRLLGLAKGEDTEEAPTQA